MRGIVVVRCLLLAWLLIVGTSAAAQAPEDGAEEAAVAQPAAVLLEEVEQLRSQYREFAAQRDELEGEERAIAELQMRKRLLEFFRKMAKLIAEVTSLDEAQADAVALRKRTRALVAELDERIEPFLDAIQEDLSKLRTVRREAPEAEFKDFDARIPGLEQNLDEPEAEYLLPDVVGDLIGDGRARVRVLPGGGPWFGVTYKQDREVVVRSIRELIDEGAYPEHLWA